MWENLREEKGEMLKDKVLNITEWNDDSNPNEMWARMFRLIKEIAKEVMGQTKGIRMGSHKDTWWWNAKVKKLKRKINLRFGRKQRRW